MQYQDLFQKYVVTLQEKRKFQKLSPNIITIYGIKILKKSIYTEYIYKKMESCAGMEKVLEIYKWPYDPRFPLACRKYYPKEAKNVSVSARSRV